jgi:hypothetical protein
MVGIKRRESKIGGRRNAGVLAVALVLAAALVVLSVAGAVAESALSAPDAPLVLAAGDHVALAWTLPPDARARDVILLRAEKDDSRFEELARLPASELRYTDRDVKPGRTYQYVLRLVRGSASSELSPYAEVSVGGTDRVVFLGGSTERAWFEVVRFVGGTRVSARFVHKPGQAIGDLAYVPALEATLDFRLGHRLETLTLDVAPAQDVTRAPLSRADGKAMTDAAGRPVELTFRHAGPRREIVTALVRGRDGATRVLAEGEGYGG